MPGPPVTLITANSTRHASPAGLANVAGTQAGLAVMIAIVGIGLNTLISGMGHWFEWVRLIGAAYLTVVCLLPEFLTSQYAVPFYFGGTSLLIVVTVTMDTVAQVHSHLLAHQYEGLIKKSKLRGSRR